MPNDDIDLSDFETDAAMPPYAGAAGDWPTLNDWSAIRYAKDICLEGIVHGHGRLPDGEIRTSPVSRIARDRSWAQTSNTVYALGEQAKKPQPEHIPHVLQLACCPDWDAAFELLTSWTEPLAPPRCRDALRGLMKPDLPWSERRAIIAVIRQELSAAGHHRLGDVWSIAGTDPDEWSACKVAANAIDAAFNEWSANRGGADDAAGRTMKRMVAGWHAMAYRSGGALVLSAQQDPIALAREIAEDLATNEDDLMKEAGNKREGKLLDKLRKPVPPEPAGPGVVVIPRIGGNAKSWNNRPSCEDFRPLEGKNLPLVAVPDLAEAREKLAAEFPHASAQVDILLSDLVGTDGVTFRPTLLVSQQPGTGKSTLAARLGETFSLHIARYDGAASNDSSFGGCARHWSTAEPSVPLAAVRDSGTANPLIIVDEIDKATKSSNNGGLAQSLLPLFGTMSAKYADIYISAAVDLSHVSYILTANDELALQKPLRDRLRILRIPTPTAAHLPALSKTILRELFAERGIDHALSMSMALDGDELHIAAGLWPTGGSIRKLRAIIERLLARRDDQAPRH